MSCRPFILPKTAVCSSYQMMMSYFKGTADAVAEYGTAVSCPNALYTF